MVSVKTPADGAVVALAAINDPAAVHMIPKNAGELWPHRQKDLISEVNKRLPDGHKMTTHDVTCIKVHLHLLEEHPEFVFKPHKLASPQYSREFVDWIVECHKKDSSLFQACRERYKNRSSQKSAS